MAQGIILTRANLYDITITGGNSPTETPVGELLTDQPGDVWQSDDLDDLYLVMDLGSAQDVNTVALLFTNATSSATWRIRAADSEANLTSAPGYDSTAVPLWTSTGIDDNRPHAFIYFPTPKSYRWWRIDIADASNPAGKFQAGRLILSKALAPARNVSYGWGRGLVHSGGAERTRDGALYARTGAVYPTTRFRLNFLSQAEAEGSLYGQLARAIGSEPVLFAQDPETADYRMTRLAYGLLYLDSDLALAAFNAYSLSLRIEGMI